MRIVNTTSLLSKLYVIHSIESNTLTEMIERTRTGDSIIPGYAEMFGRQCPPSLLLLLYDDGVIKRLAEMIDFRHK